jgi:hypothetical protein
MGLVKKWEKEGLGREISHGDIKTRHTPRNAVSGRSVGKVARKVIRRKL